MKIIFLDIDGVLNSATYDRTRDWTKQTDIDVSRLPLLKRIVDETGAKIVLSSTWRTHWNADGEKCDEDGKYINSTFEDFGLEVYDKTPDHGLFGERAEEIAEWLENNEDIEAFVIIDDSPFGWNELSEYTVKTNPFRGLGLEEEGVRRAIEILTTE